jgi:hypothetical protein
MTGTHQATRGNRNPRTGGNGEHGFSYFGGGGNPIGQKFNLD